MKPFWVEFTDGSAACCEGASVFDAMCIAEHMAPGKTVAVKKEFASGVRPPNWQSAKFAVYELPYPARPILWQVEHPIHGKTPPFCYRPSLCKDRTACPTAPSCLEEVCSETWVQASVFRRRP